MDSGSDASQARMRSAYRAASRASPTSMYTFAVWRLPDSMDKPIASTSCIARGASNRVVTRCSAAIQ